MRSHDKVFQPSESVNSLGRLEFELEPRAGTELNVQKCTLLPALLEIRPRLWPYDFLEPQSSAMWGEENPQPPLIIRPNAERRLSTINIKSVPPRFITLKTRQ